MFGLNKKTLVLIAVAVVVFIFVTGFSLRKIFGGKSAKAKEFKQEKQEERAEKKVIDTKLKQSDFFNPTSLSLYPKHYQLPSADADKLAKKLKIEMLVYRGRLSKLMGYFGMLTHKVQVAQLAYIYRTKYSRDLSTDLVRFLTKKQVQTLFGKLTQIPT